MFYGLVLNSKGETHASQEGRLVLVQFVLARKLRCANKLELEVVCGVLLHDFQFCELNIGGKTGHLLD